MLKLDLGESLRATVFDTVKIKVSLTFLDVPNVLIDLELRLLLLCKIFTFHLSVINGVLSLEGKASGTNTFHEVVVLLVFRMPETVLLLLGPLLGSYLLFQLLDKDFLHLSIISHCIYVHASFLSLLSQRLGHDDHVLQLLLELILKVTSLRLIINFLELIS